MNKIVSFVLLLLPALANAQQQPSFEQAADLFNAGKYDAALTMTNQLLQQNDRNAAVYELRGSIYEKMKNADQAVTNYKLAVKYDPHNVFYLSRRANYYFVLDYYNNSIDDNTKALKYADSDSVRIMLLVNRSQARDKKGDYPGAYMDLRQALQIDSVNYRALMEMEGVLVDGGKPLESIAYLRTAHQHYPNEVAPMNDIAFRYLDMEKYDEAIEAFKETLKISPEDAYVYNNMAYAEYMKQDLDDALKDVNHSISLYSRNSQAYKNRALIYLSLKQRDKACPDLDTAIKLGYTEQYDTEVEDLKQQYCK
jgi:tetratricopeptide (TPR) repeat protein